MDALIDLVWPPTAWHWLTLALVLLAIETMLGTFDLLWVSIAAGATALFSAFAIIGSNSWQGQFLFFAAAAVGLVVLGRTVFADMRKKDAEHPTLNRLMSRTIGQRATVIAALALLLLVYSFAVDTWWLAAGGISLRPSRNPSNVDAA